MDNKPFLYTAALGVVFAAFSMGTAWAQMTKTSDKFDFGPGKPAAGYTQVLPTTAYSAQLGYGYEPGFVGLGPDKPKLFSVALPEGSYNIAITFGGSKTASDTTIKAEARRLMLWDVKTAPGQRVTRIFTVNIRTPNISTGGEVHLKPREAGPPLDKDWDDKLTLEFNGPSPRVDNIAISPAPGVVTLYILGDSTVVDQPDEPWCAWGQILPSFFKAGLSVANNAESGETLRSSLGARRLDKVLSTMKPGDYLFIQYGHNDQKEHGPGVGAFTTYAADLTLFVTEVRKHGCLPVLVTPMNRRFFDAEGKIVNTLGDYPDAVRKVAKEQNVPLIDLNAMSKTLFEAMGPEGTLKAFVHYPAGTFPGQVKALKDNTHFNSYGAYELARCVVDGIKADKLGLTKYLKSDTPMFDPAHPDLPNSIDIPASPWVSTTKPYGS
jgi:lysophospholipase L1-like esterase